MTGRPGTPSPDQADKAAISLLTPAQAHALRVVPLRIDGDCVAVAVEKGTAASITGWTYLTGRDASLVETEPSVLVAALVRHYGAHQGEVTRPAVPESVAGSWSGRETALFMAFWSLLRNVVLARAGRLRLRPSGEVAAETRTPSGWEALPPWESVPPDLYGFLQGLVGDMAAAEATWAFPVTLFGDQRFQVAVTPVGGELRIDVGTPDPPDGAGPMRDRAGPGE